MLNNGLYGIEELLSVAAGHVYDDLPAVEHHLLPAAFGCKDWVSKRCVTMEDFVSATKEAVGKSAYYEIMQDKSDAPHPMPEAILNGLYKSFPTMKFRKSAGK